jgi:hypothetical protein
MIEPERRNLGLRDRPSDPTEPRPPTRLDNDRTQPLDPEKSPDVHGDPENPT